MRRRLMQLLKKLLRREDRRIDLGESTSIPEVELQNFRAFDRELRSRLQALQIESDVIGRRRMTDSGEMS